tara:strand:+ start:1167 stop:2135 length:969 start_codon:yes stop_codon:yes gene_type:complete
MFTNDLYKTALCNPAKGNSSLYIVSGYSSATFAKRHLKDLSSIDKNIDVNLIIGMNGNRSDHQAYLDLKRHYKSLLNVYYIKSYPEVHAKAYAWLGENPQGFSGSANYSQQAFIGSQVNQLGDTDPYTIKNFYDSLMPRTESITTYKPIPQKIVPIIPQPRGSVQPGKIQWLIPDTSVRISFLAKDGEVPSASGLNWGHSTASKNKNKPSQPRDRNDAYLSIKTDATKEGFLPDKGFTFTMNADDGYVMDCVVAQDGRKSVQTTDGNPILGSYIRKRLGVPSGKFLTASDLIRYGRTDFTLTKLDDETFEFDISLNNTNQVS